MQCMMLAKDYASLTSSDELTHRPNRPWPRAPRC